jgi:hypothetical protein
LHAYTPNDYADAGNTIILDLKQHDQVFLRAVHANTLFGKGGRHAMTQVVLILENIQPNLPITFA